MTELRPDGQRIIDLQRALANARPQWDLAERGRSRSQETWHWFGSGEHGVVAGLCDLLDRHLARPRGRFNPAAIGCVPWFNNMKIAERLAQMRGCVVVNKPKGRISAAMTALDQMGRGIASEWIEGMEGLAPLDHGQPRLVGPGDRMGCTLGPVRLFGHRQRADGAMVPLLHSKLLVLGGIYEGDGCDYDTMFLPDTVWIGSANWTDEAERHHIEAAVAVADREFVRSTMHQLVSILSRSEPMGTHRADPTPDLGGFELDNAAFADYAADRWR